MVLRPVDDSACHARIRASLGGAQVLRHTATDTPAVLVRMIREGLPAESAIHARESLGLSHQAFDRVLPRSTLASALRRQGRTLSKSASENLYRLAHLAAIAEAVFGDRKRAAYWLSTPNPVFDGEPPITLADTEIGTDWVETVLMRAMYGVTA